ncbi:hypothetical protein SOVF_021580 [Spinacia oleracea]|nr:hypothetical protein SOVF_021580 [Spinacia oleracea]
MNLETKVSIETWFLELKAQRAGDQRGTGENEEDRGGVVVAEGLDGAAARKRAVDATVVVFEWWRNSKERKGWSTKQGKNRGGAFLVKPGRRSSSSPSFVRRR